MSKGSYYQIRDEILFEKFEKVKPKRKNEKHPVLKEEEDIISVLMSLKDNGEID